MCTIFSQYWICVPSQLQHSCLNSTPALLLFPCRGLLLRGVESALCFYKLVVLSGFASLALYHLLLLNPLNKSATNDYRCCVTLFELGTESCKTTLITCSFFGNGALAFCLSGSQSSVGSVCHVKERRVLCLCVCVGGGETFAGSEESHL